MNVFDKHGAPRGAGPLAAAKTANRLIRHSWVGGGSVRGGQVDGKVLERVAEGWQRGGGKGVWLQKWI